ncbi:protein CcmA, bactofilin family [Noviherbaspirillum humi]|uniref:Protein CcmA, bactofilin family n=1 Tax=Noviherbaspirillum humi TaxID=1688639 RepID=A0A239GTT6_9BURK|nr:polymer-forming cytoskeletal protein [Noviherbaspirillum humi]SNS71923.1 protein CcmA, bactofilin family [Noviherbaspirillum humi]
MLRSDSLFGKRDNPTNSPLNGSPATGVMPASAAGGMTKPAPIGGLSAVPSAPASSDAQAGNAEAGSKLIVGPNIKLKGVEITDCHTLVVEGRVEATMDSNVIQIAECGAFIGKAEIDIAEIRGEFDGELIVRQKLVIYATGRVTGKIRYGKLVIEEGGQISGEIQVGVNAPAKPLTVAKAG